MKSLLLLLVCAGLIFFRFSASGQGDKKTITAQSSSLFLQGKNRVILERNLSFDRLSNYFNDTKNGHSNDFQLHAGYSRFIIDGLAIGADIDANFSGDHSGINDVLVRNLTVAPHALYGHSLSGAINMYVKTEIGVGSSTQPAAIPIRLTCLDLAQRLDFRYNL
jgi:hypothetical protein